MKLTTTERLENGNLKLTIAVDLQFSRPHHVPFADIAIHHPENHRRRLSPWIDHQPGQKRPAAHLDRTGENPAEMTEPANAAGQKPAAFLFPVSVADKSPISILWLDLYYPA